MIAVADAPRERPILMRGELVVKSLADEKTQTRRPAKFEPLESGLNLAFSGLDAGLYHCGRPDLGWVLRSRGAGGCWNDRTHPLRCRYGAPGDRLWVKETFVYRHKYDRAYYRADHPTFDPYAHDGWKPSIHMPRRLSRLLLEIVAVRVERVQAITEEDAKAEGVEPAEARDGGMSLPEYAPHRPVLSYRAGFEKVWRTIHKSGPFAWEANPWVWAITYRRVP